MPDSPPPGVPASDDERPAPRSAWLHGWRALAAAALASLVVALLALSAWIAGDGDVRAVDARARTMGVPLAWDELPGRAPPSADRLAAWTRAAAIAKALPRWEAPSATPPRRLPHVGEPAPAELVAHVAALDGAKLAELDAALDALGDEPLVRHATMTARTLMPEITEGRAIASLMRERILADPADRVAGDALRVLRCARTIESPTFLAELVEASLEMIAIHSITRRIPDLRQAGPADVVAALRADAAMAWPRIELAQTGEFLFARDLVTHPPSELVSEAFSGDGSPPRVLARLYVAAGRRDLLDADLDTIAQARLRDARASLDRALAVQRSLAGVSRWSLRRSLTTELAPAVSLALRNRFRCALHSLVLAAELDGGDWPIDLLARDGSRLKRIERDGALVAAYSVGEDGVDDGGDPKKDLVFELYGTVTKPSAATR